MDYKYIEQLLERYFDCQTTLEEEQILRSFFSQKDVPAHLKDYANLFAYEQNAKSVHLDEDFDKRVLAIVEKPVVKAKVINMRNRMAPLFKAAAVVAIVLTISNMAERSFNDKSQYPQSEIAPTFADTYVTTEKIPSAVKIIDRSQAEAKSIGDSLLSIPSVGNTDNINKVSQE